MSVLKIKDEDGNWVPIHTIKGDIGPVGPQGPTGADGKDAVTDPSYNPTSENAQSGKAVAQAVETHNKDTEAHMDIRGKVNDNVREIGAIASALSSQYDRISILQETTLTKEFATRYDNTNLAVGGVFEFKPNSLIFCSGNGKNLTLKKWNGAADEILVENSPTVICICSQVKTVAKTGAQYWEALFIYQTEKNYGLVTLPNMVLGVTTISLAYDNTLTLTNTGNANTNDAYIFYQHTGE